MAWTVFILSHLTTPARSASTHTLGDCVLFIHLRPKHRQATMASSQLENAMACPTRSPEADIRNNAISVTPIGGGQGIVLSFQDLQNPSAYQTFRASYSYSTQSFFVHVYQRGGSSNNHPSRCPQIHSFDIYSFLPLASSASLTLRLTREDG